MSYLVIVGQLLIIIEFLAQINLQWDQEKGANIQGAAAAAVFDAYVSQKVPLHCLI